MTKMVVNARVGTDGVLRVNLPVGIHEANQEVRETVEASLPRKTDSPVVYAAWVDSLAGSWQGEFERPPQGELQERETL